MKKKKKIIVIIIGSVVTALALSIAIPFMIFGIRSADLEADYSYLKNDTAYSQKVEITNLELVNQHISCGYATIEMLSNYYGDRVSEDDLNSKNRTISTSSSRGFLKEINQSIPSKHFIMHTYLKHDVLLKEIHISLKKENPVTIEWAAKYEDEWTLHFSIVSEIDIASDNVQVYNPYGYIENITIDEFINRTSFASYRNMPLFLDFGFAYGAFHKNTIFFAN